MAALLHLAARRCALIVSDENKTVLSSLLFFSSLGFKADHFLGQVAEILSRTLSLYLQRKMGQEAAAT